MDETRRREAEDQEAQAHAIADTAFERMLAPAIFRIIKVSSPPTAPEEQEALRNTTLCMVLILMLLEVFLLKLKYLGVWYQCDGKNR